MSFPSYPKYKSSGVEWLGEVPEHWELRRLGFLADERREKVSDRDFAAISVTKRGLVPQLETAAKTDDGDNRRLVRKGDFVINSRSDRRGSAGVAPMDGSVSLINTVLALRDSLVATYAHHLLRSGGFQEEFYRFGKGIVADLWSTNFSEMKDILIPIPTPVEQRAIAAFLDSETAKIDALIAEQEKLIELLAEKRQAVISNAVTKGLNPAAPMKPSGIECLGDVPAHWELRRLGEISRKIGSGKTPSGGAEVYSDVGATFLRSQNVMDGLLDLSDVAFIPFEIDASMPGSRVETGDILLNITGASLGRSAYVERDIGPANVNQHVCIIRLRCAQGGPFVALFLRSAQAQAQIETAQTGAAREGLNFAQVARLVVAIPPPEERNLLLRLTEKSLLLTSGLTEEASRAVGLLRERRSALISAVVTGQIDVRNAVPENAA